VTSNKGGIGKSTIATNLAICARALREDVPILVMSFDDQFLLEHMFALEAKPQKPTIVDVMREGNLGPAIRLGQHGVGYVPSSATIGDYKRELTSPFELRRILELSGWEGLVIVDTKSDLEILTQNAIAASDLAVIVVADSVSLTEAEKVYALLDTWGHPREHARILFSLVDLRAKYCENEHRDAHALLISETQRRGYRLLESVVSRSHTIESLFTKPEGRARSVLHAAREWLLQRQVQQLACELLETLDRLPALPDLPPEATLPGSSRPAEASAPRPPTKQPVQAWEQHLFTVDELMGENARPDSAENEPGG
jgi:cellulose biosynthesis protein BcsQ